jgi:hypothetical protein
VVGRHHRDVAPVLRVHVVRAALPPGVDFTNQPRP